MGKTSPDLSPSRHWHVEFIFHALRGAMGIRTPDLLNAIDFWQPTHAIDFTS